MLEGVTIEQLRTLRAVAAAGSFSAAARKLGRVQAAVSQSIERLEAQLGLRLFDRSGRVARLTAHGEAVVAAAARVEDGVEALDALVASLKRGAETTLRIVVDVLFPIEALATFAGDFDAAHPGVALVIFTDILSAVTAHVREKRSAFGIAVEDADMDGLDRRAVADVRLVPVAAQAHPLGRRRAHAAEEGPLDTAALAGAVQIVLGEHREEAKRGSDLHGVLSPRQWRVVDLATKHALIRHGLGWGHMPEHVVRDDLRAGRLVALDLAAWGPSVRRALVLVRRPDAVPGPVARWAQARLTDLCRRGVDDGDPPHQPP
jgi:DNA-binding transcriptional LysR family regulator